jgi:hypothetical protein
MGCGKVTGTSNKDAAPPLDVPHWSGGALGTGGLRGSGGAPGTDGAGTVASGGVAAGGITSTVTGGGGSAVLGGTPGTGGTVATGGTPAAGGSGGSPGGVVLIATYDGQVHATWQNQTSQSIFLYGCGTVEWSRLEGSAWVNHGAFILCAWEGIAVEVAAGTTYTETESFAGAEAGRYRLSGRYGVGCTPGLGLSSAGCTAFFEATSNEFVVPATGGSGGAGSGGLLGSGGSGAGGTAAGGRGGSVTGGTGGTATTDAGAAGGTTGFDAGQASIYSGCIFIGGINRAVVAKFDPQAGVCVALVLAQPGGSGDGGFGLTISQSWGVESTSLWQSATADCAQRFAPGGAASATSASGSVSVDTSSTTIDVDAVLYFPASDAGAAQSIEMKAQGVDINHGC